jgi:hypothetical protein
VLFARQEREKRRSEFLEHLIATLTEAEELRAFLRRLHEEMLTSSTGELMRFKEWTEAKLGCLEDD